MEMEEIKMPEISSRFDVDDIRKIRDYDAQRYSRMTDAEIAADIRNGAERIIKKYGLKFTYAQKLR